MNRNFRIQTADQPNHSVLTLRGRGIAVGIGGPGSRGLHPELASGTEDVRIRKKCHGLFIRIGHTESGCGMDADTLALIFEPCYSTKGNDGTGLGLSVVHGVVVEHGGGTRPVIACAADTEEATARTFPGRSGGAFALHPLRAGGIARGT